MNYTHKQKPSTPSNKFFSTATSVADTSLQNEDLQKKANLANNTTQRAEAPRANNTGMPDNLKAGIESLSGFSMDDVRVHYNSSKPATVQALAYTQGTDIHVAPGQEKHLPHEAWHVAQQMAGRVSPTTNINGMPVNDNAALEHEADVMGEKALMQRYSINENKFSHYIGISTIQKCTLQEKTISNNEVAQRVEIEVKDDPYDSSFKENIKNALEKIEGTYYVKAIRNSKKDPENRWTDILILNSTSGRGSGFNDGDMTEDKKLKLEMDIGQCENMYWGDKEKPTKEDVNTETSIVLLHELGHAYQYYLNKESFKQKFVSDDLNDYPLLNECIKQIYNGDENALRRLIEAIKAFYDDKHDILKTTSFKLFNRYFNEGEIGKFIKTPIKQKMKSGRIQVLLDIIKDTLKKIAQTAYKPNLDADNLFMNEIPFAVANKQKGDSKIGIRYSYGKSIDIRESQLNDVFTRNGHPILGNYDWIDKWYVNWIKYHANKIYPNYYLSSRHDLWDACAKIEIQIALERIAQEKKDLNQGIEATTLQESNPNINDKFLRLYDNLIIEQLSKVGKKLLPKK